MWPRNADPRAEAFGRYWDALARGATSDEAAKLRERVDPALVAATERVRADYRPRQADPAFVARLERDLMQALSAGPDPLRSSSPFDHAGPSPFVDPSPRSPSRGRVRAWRPSVALRGALALLVLLFAVVGGWALVGGPRPWEDEHPHAAIQAPPLTPEATPDPATHQGVLIDVILPDPPGHPVAIRIEQGHYSARGALLGNCMGGSNAAILVTQGELTASVGGPADVFAEVIRGIGGPAEGLASDAPIRLAAGDALAMGAQARFQTELATGTSVLVIGFTIEAADRDACGPANTTAGIQELGLGYGAYPAGPLRLVVRRVILKPGESYRHPAVDGQIVVLGRENPLATIRIVGSDATNTADKPVNLLVMTLDPVVRPGTPTGSPTN